MEATATAATPERPRLLAVGSWVLYDLANTIFSMNIVTLYFSLWVINDMGGKDSDYALANSLSMFIVFLVAPFLGALSDQTPRRMPFLIVSTLVCCAATLLLGMTGVFLALVIFIVANTFYQSGLIFYDALLPVVSTKENRGRVGGIGIGVGYMGSFIGVLTGLIVLENLLGLAILESNPADKPLVFKLTAVLFLLFALPCFFWVREKPRAGSVMLGPKAAKRAIHDLRNTFVRLDKLPNLRRFLIGRVFYTDAANTFIIFMGIYLTNEVDFTEAQVQIALILGIAAAMVGGLSWGFVVDWIGPRPSLLIVIGLWTIAIILTVAVPLFSLTSSIFWAVAPLGGFALGSTWAADRPLMLRLAPPQNIGQFYGLYAMVGRFAAIIGPLLWALIVNGLDWGRPAAVAAFLPMMAIAAWFIFRVDDTADLGEEIEETFQPA
ncbi:MAG: MFS transporter [Chloroflexota bacterium]|nr:MFS transporter [Chloroflexota bacterium]MDE2929854.1 MFS transporter [Chloroflexota bacterium]